MTDADAANWSGAPVAGLAGAHDGVAHLPAAPIIEGVIGVPPALDGFELPPERIRVAASLDEAVELAGRALSATLVLPYDRAAAFEELAQAVIAIRALGLGGVRIAVRECGARLRIAQADALVRLGATLVIPAQVASPMARVMIDGLSGTRIAPPAAWDTQAVIARAHGSMSNMSLLAPETFRQACRHWLHSARGLPHVMLHLVPRTPAAARAIGTMLQRQVRDMLITEQDGALWVMLRACPPEAADGVLARALGRRFEYLLEGWRRVDGLRPIADLVDAMAPVPGAVSAATP